jgi:bidirectional [NiFe] hydrogenase diaphorase subunit
MICLTINQNALSVEEGRTLLEACREHGIHIPTLCYHPALEPYGGCRLCMVEIFSSNRPPRLMAACVTPCEEGMIVETETESVIQSRRTMAELFLASAYDQPEMLALGRELGVRDIRFKLPVTEACILCGLCVRACREIVGVSAIGFIQRGMAKKVSTPFQISSATCIGCGTCVLICPTAAIKLSDIALPRSIHSTDNCFQQRYCQICGDEVRGPQYFTDADNLLEIAS